MDRYGWVGMEERGTMYSSFYIIAHFIVVFAEFTTIYYYYVFETTLLNFLIN